MPRQSAHMQPIASDDWGGPASGLLTVSALRWFDVRAFLPLVELPSKADESQLPGANGLGASDPPSPLLLLVYAVPPRAGQELDLVVRGFLRRTPFESIL